MVLELKFFGLGLKDNYQAYVNLYYHGELVFNGMTYNGKLCFNNLSNDWYLMEALFGNERIITPIYFKNGTYCFFFNHSYLSNKIITLTLVDYFYNLPIEEGELILWQR